jgi:Flp pilus assembly protein TadB
MTLWLAVTVAAAWWCWPGPRRVDRGLLLPARGGAEAGRPGDPPGHPGDRTGDLVAGDAAPAREVPAVEVADAVDLLALSLHGGAGLVEAIEAVASRLDGPLGAHLHTVAAAERWGVGTVAAWASVPSAWQPAARALRMAATAGVAPADLLARAADDIRRAEEQRLDVATARLGVRVVLPLGLLFLPAFVLTTVVPIVLALATQVLGRP